MLRLGRFFTTLHHPKIKLRVGLINLTILRNYATPKPRPKIEDYGSTQSLKLVFDYDNYDVMQRLNKNEIKKHMAKLKQRQFSKKDYDNIIKNFEVILSTVSAFPNQDLLALLFESWQTIMIQPSGDVTDSSGISINTLQAQMLTYRHSLIHILINTKNYPVYETIMAPIYMQHKPELLWVDRVMATLQMKYENDKLTVNNTRIMSFLKNEDNSLHQKRLLLTNMVKAGFMNTENDQEKTFVIEKFFYYLQFIGDDHCLFTTQEYQVYEKALKRIVMPFEGISDHLNLLKNMFDRLNYSKVSYCNFLTSAMNAVVHFSPNNALSYWKHKHDYAADYYLSTEEVFNYHDLKAAMIAFNELKLHSRALSTYAAYPYLHDDDQIEVILKIAEESRDWKLLQIQFEDMYGRGELPAIVHYSVVMNALASKGGIEDVDALYRQILKRKLIPKDQIFAALIKSRLYHNKIDEALKIFKNLQNTPDYEVKSVSLFSLIFKLYLRSNDTDAAFKFLKESTEEFNRNLATSRVYVDFINYAKSNYNAKLITVLQLQAQSSGNLLNRVYVSLITAYTGMCQFEMADRLIMDLHQDCDIPFTDLEVYSLQYKNYFEWWKFSTNSIEKQNLADKLNYIEWLALGTKKMSLRGIHGIAHEASKYYIHKNKVDKAFEMLDEIKANESLKEIHYLPFLKYFSSKKNIKGCQKTIDLYEEMVDSKIEVTSKTYVYLMEASLYMDDHSNQDRGKFDRSLKMLKFILEAYGLTYKATDQKLNPLISLVAANANNLCRIVSSFALTVGGHIGNTELVVHFLNQIKETLGGRTSESFRRTILKEMSTVYLLEGNLTLAESLIDNGLKDIHSKLEEFSADYPFEDFRIPKALQYENTSLIKIKLECLESRLEGDTKRRAFEFAKVLHHSTRNKLPLTPYQYHRIFTTLLKRSPQKYLRWIISICDEHLISGNIVELQIEKRRHYLYQLAMFNLFEWKGPNYIQKFDILNEYYGVHDLQVLSRKFKNIDNIGSRLVKSVIRENGKLKENKWTVDGIYRNIPGYFSPEHALKVENRISDSTRKLLYSAFKDCYKSRPEVAFSMMENYPLTVDYILRHKTEQERMELFRNRIDNLRPPKPRESPQDRISRTFRAMFYMGLDGAHGIQHIGSPVKSI